MLVLYTDIAGNFSSMQAVSADMYAFKQRHVVPLDDISTGDGAKLALMGVCSYHLN